MHQRPTAPARGRGLPRRCGTFVITSNCPHQDAPHGSKRGRIDTVILPITVAEELHMRMR
jgi:hypothetical protein